MVLCKGKGKITWNQLVTGYIIWSPSWEHITAACDDWCVHDRMSLCKWYTLLRNFFFYLVIINIQYYFSFRCMTQWFDIFTYHETNSTINPVTIHYYTKLLQYYWLCSVCVHYILMTYLFYSCTSPSSCPLQLQPARQNHQNSWHRRCSHTRSLLRDQEG